MGLWIVTLLVSLPLSMSLTGCAKTVVLHPITEQDIKMLNSGETFTAPKNGAFLSDFYIEKVMKARAE